jgi:DNA polymerase-3 subunit epsilon
MACSELKSYSSPMKNSKIQIPTALSKEKIVFIAIETSGLRPSKDRIIEIDLVVANKGVIKTQWHTHLHYKKNSSSSKKAPHPAFSEIALKLYKLLKNKIIIAHNAGFIYEFLKAEMSRSNLILDEKILCSISLSRYLFPESKEHHPQAISKRLSLDIQEATPLSLLLNFFGKLEELITPEDLQNKMKELIQSPVDILSVDHKGMIPETAGIYRCYDKNNVVIYVGKSTSLSESLSSHFQLTQNAHKELPIAKQIKKIDWIKTHGELGTLLFSSKYIKHSKPLFNRLIEKNKNLYTIQLVHNRDYLALKVIAVSKLSAMEFPETFGIFKYEKDANNLLKFFITESNLCHQINSLEKSKHPCFRFKINKCKGACNNLESAEDYNKRIHKIIKTFTQNKWPFKNKIAIKEQCNKTGETHFHLIHHWVYLDTVKSLEKIDTFALQDTEIDIGIYQYLQKFLIKEDNTQSIIEIL